MKAWNNGHEQAQCSKDGDHDDDWHEMEREEEEAHRTHCARAPPAADWIGRQRVGANKAAVIGLDIYFASTLVPATSACM